MVVSTLYPYFVYNQSIISTLLAQRENYSILGLLLFLYIHPNEKDFFIALRFCSYLCIAIMLVSIFFPSFFLTEKRLDHLLSSQSKGSTDLVTATNGARLLVFYFFIQISRLLNNPKTKSIIEAVFLILMLVLLQNRSTLIIAVPVFLYAFMKIKTKRKVLYWILGIAVLSVFSGYIIKTSIGLWEESADQLGDMDYNRWQAISFFLIESKSNLFTFFFGHGISASGSAYLDILLAAQEERFAYISDLGLLGSYFLYGILFVGIVYFFAFKALKNKQPHYIKFYALFIILVPTIQNIGLFSSGVAILFSMFFYLVLYNSKYHKLLVYIKSLNLTNALK